MKKQNKLLIAIIMLVTVLMTGCMTRETLKANEFKINLENRYAAMDVQPMLTRLLKVNIHAKVFSKFSAI